VNILIADPDRHDRNWIARHLSAAGHEVTLVGDGISAIAAIEKAPYSLAVTEWNLGDMTGLDMAGAIKSSPHGHDIRILLVSSCADSANISHVIDRGVDDYLAKSCQADELIARTNAVLRRPSVTPLEGVLRAGPLTLDKVAHKVTAGSTEIRLSPVEFRLVKFFMENPGRVFDRQQLLELVWRRRRGIGPRTVDVHVRRLRAALEPHACDHLLQTVRGFGYRFG